jgi:hypothetical protein
MKPFIIVAVVFACAACTNNNTDGAAVGLKAGKSSPDTAEMSGIHDTTKGKRDPDMDQHEMYNYADSAPEGANRK